MKTLSILFLTILLSWRTYSQSDTAIIVAIDPLGRTDTVFFGSSPMATLGVDAALGETDIYGQPYDSLDLRIEQRLVMCGELGLPSLFYPANVDMKKDIRPAIGGTFPEYSNFSLRVVSDTFPVYIKLQKYNLNLMAMVFKYDTTCFYDLDTIICPWFGCVLPDTILTINSDTESVFRIYPEVIIGIKEELQENVSVSPNPSKNLVQIRNRKSALNHVRIFNSSGQVVIELNNLYGVQSAEMDVSSFLPGMYVIQIISDNSVLMKKLLKE